MFYLCLFVWTFLTVLWTILQWAFPLGQVDMFRGRHAGEIRNLVGDEESAPLLASMSATIIEQTRMTVLFVGVPLLITTFGWFAMFTRYVRPND